MGARPCVPDGLPLVGKLRSYKNLIIATGHCRLGLTLAAITSKIVADILNNRENEFMEVLSPARIGL